MPIRMTDDPQDQQEQYSNDGGGGGNVPLGPGSNSLNRSLGSLLVRNVRYSSTRTGAMRFDVSGDANNVVACIVEITK